MIILAFLPYLYQISTTQLHSDNIKESIFWTMQTSEIVSTLLPYFAFLNNWLPPGYHRATSLPQYRKWHLNFSPSKSHPTTIPHIPVAQERCEHFRNFNSSCDSNCTLEQRQITELIFVSLSTHYKLHLLCVPDTASLVDVHKPYWPNFSNVSIYSIIRHPGTPATSNSWYKLSAFEN